LDESCTSNSKSEIADWTGSEYGLAVQFQISDFEFEVQDSSNFKFSLQLSCHCETLVRCLDENSSVHVPSILAI